jgi:hypothetical protein
MGHALEPEHPIWTPALPTCHATAGMNLLCIQQRHSTLTAVFKMEPRFFRIILLFTVYHLHSITNFSATCKKVILLRKQSMLSWIKRCYFKGGSWPPGAMASHLLMDMTVSAFAMTIQSEACWDGSLPKCGCLASSLTTKIQKQSVPVTKESAGSEAERFGGSYDLILL